MTLDTLGPMVEGLGVRTQVHGCGMEGGSSRDSPSHVAGRVSPLGGGPASCLVISSLERDIQDTEMKPVER